MHKVFPESSREEALLKVYDGIFHSNIRFQWSDCRKVETRTKGKDLKCIVFWIEFVHLSYEDMNDFWIRSETLESCIRGTSKYSLSPLSAAC